MRELMQKYKEIISYLFWGVMTTGVSWGSYAVLSLLFSTTTENAVLVSSLSNVLSIAIAILFAFVTNKLWVFLSKSWAPSVVLPEFLKFISARSVTAVIETLGVPLLVSLGVDGAVFGVEGMVAKALVSVIVIILNYVFSKLFIFKDKKNNG